MDHHPAQVGRSETLKMESFATGAPRAPEKHWATSKKVLSAMDHPKEQVGHYLMLKTVLSETEPLSGREE